MYSASRRGISSRKQTTIVRTSASPVEEDAARNKDDTGSLELLNVSTSREDLSRRGSRCSCYSGESTSLHKSDSKEVLLDSSWTNANLKMELDNKANAGSEDELLKDELLRIFDRERFGLESYFKQKTERIIHDYRRKQCEWEETLRAEKIELEKSLAQEKIEVQQNYISEMTKMTKQFNQERVELESHYKKQIAELTQQFAIMKKEMDETILKERTELKQRLEFEYQSMLKCQRTSDEQYHKEKISEFELEYKRKISVLEEKIKDVVSENDLSVRKAQSELEGKFESERSLLIMEWRKRVEMLELELGKERERANKEERKVFEFQALLKSETTKKETEVEKLRQSVETLRSELSLKEKAAKDYEVLQQNIFLRGTEALPGKLREDFEKMLAKHRTELEEALKKERDVERDLRGMLDKDTFEKQLQFERDRMALTMEKERAEMRRAAREKEDSLREELKREVDEVKKTLEEENKTFREQFRDELGKERLHVGERFLKEKDENNKEMQRQLQQFFDIRDEERKATSKDDQKITNSVHDETKTTTIKEIERNVVRKEEDVVYMKSAHKEETRRDLNDQRIANTKQWVEDIQHTSFQDNKMKDSLSVIEEDKESRANVYKDEQYDQRSYSEDTKNRKDEHYKDNTDRRYYDHQGRKEYNDGRYVSRDGQEYRDKYYSNGRHTWDGDGAAGITEYNDSRYRDGRRQLDGDDGTKDPVNSNNGQRGAREDRGGVQDSGRSPRGKGSGVRQNGENHSDPDKNFAIDISLNVDSANTKGDYVQRSSNPDDSGLKAKIAALEENIELHQSYKAEATKEIERLRNANKELKEQLDVVKTALEHYEEHAENLEEYLEEAKEELLEQDKEIGEYEKICQNYEKTLKECRQKLVVLERDKKGKSKSGGDANENTPTTNGDDRSTQRSKDDTRHVGPTRTYHEIHNVESMQPNTSTHFEFAFNIDDLARSERPPDRGSSHVNRTARPEDRTHPIDDQASQVNDGQIHGKKKPKKPSNQHEQRLQLPEHNAPFHQPCTTNTQHSNRNNPIRYQKEANITFTESQNITMNENPIQRENTKLISVVRDLENKIQNLEKKIIEISKPSGKNDTMALENQKRELASNLAKVQRQNRDLMNRVKELQKQLQLMAEKVRKEKKKVTYYQKENRSLKYSYHTNVKELQTKLECCSKVMERLQSTSVESKTVSRLQEEVNSISKMIIEERLNEKRLLQARSVEELNKLQDLEREKNSLERKLNETKVALDGYSERLKNKFTHEMSSSQLSLNVQSRNVHLRDMRLSKTIEAVEESRKTSERQNARLVHEKKELQSLIGQLCKSQEDLRGSRLSINSSLSSSSSSSSSHSSLSSISVPPMTYSGHHGNSFSNDFSFFD